MNPESNNFNQNNSNLENNNVFNSTPLNDSLNNQSINNGIGSNPSVDNVPNPNVGIAPAPQQPAFQPNTPELTSTPTGDSNNVNVPKKNNSKVLIAVVIVFVVILIGVGIGILLNKSKSNSNSSTENSTGNQNGGTQDNSNNTLKGNIKQISFGSDEIVALMDNGDLYYIGDGENSNEIYKDSEKHSKIKKIASNVENIYYSGIAIYYINEKKELYYIGGSYNGGSAEEFKKDADNMSKIKTVSNICAFAINDKNELLAKNYSTTFCGLTERYEEFTKIADNVKDVFVGSNYGGYISNSNELYYIKPKADFAKVLDNVKSVAPLIYSNAFLILTNDNKLYIYSAEYNKDFVLTLLRDDVTLLKDNYFKTYFKTTNGDCFIVDIFSDLIFIKDKAEILFKNEYATEYYGKVDASDINEILYYVNVNRFGNKYEKALIYLSNNGKIVLQDDKNKQEMDFNINNIEKMYEFVKIKEK